MSVGMAKPVHIFISYRHADHRIVDELRDHLGWLENDDSIAVFDDRQIVAGDDWDAVIRHELGQADLIILVVSAAFMRSRYCTRIELQQALKLRSDNASRVMPIIAETCDWEAMPFHSIAALPKDKANNLKPLNKWGRDRDVALTQVAQQVRRNIERIRPSRPHDTSGQIPADPKEVLPTLTPSNHNSEELPEDLGVARVLFGVAIDTSASMETSIRNDGGQQASRYQTVIESLATMGNVFKEGSKTANVVLPDNFDVFVYCFGLRFAPGVADMGSLWKAAQNVNLETEVQDRKRRYEEQAKSESASFGSLASLAGRYGLGGLVSYAAGASIRLRILEEVAEVVKNEARRIGDVLFRPSELIEAFERSPSGHGNTLLNEVVFGQTPMALAAREVRQRFERMQGSAYDSRLLLVISDGEPTDGDPTEDFLALKKTGVIVVSCFVTDRDVIDPRTLIHSPDPTWERGTRLMWDIASGVDTSSTFSRYLVAQGWEVADGSRLFVQVNHSEVLKEFVTAIAAQSRYDIGAFTPKGR